MDAGWGVCDGKSSFRLQGEGSREGIRGHCERYCRSDAASMAATWVSRMFDRSDAAIRSRQDLVVNAAIFLAACYAIHKYGYKLAV